MSNISLFSATEQAFQKYLEEKKTTKPVIGKVDRETARKYSQQASQEISILETNMVLYKTIQRRAKPSMNTRVSQTDKKRIESVIKMMGVYIKDYERVYTVWKKYISTGSRRSVKMPLFPLYSVHATGAKFVDAATRYMKHVRSWIENESMRQKTNLKVMPFVPKYTNTRGTTLRKFPQQVTKIQESMPNRASLGRIKTKPQNRTSPPRTPNTMSNATTRKLSKTNTEKRREELLSNYNMTMNNVHNMAMELTHLREELYSLKTEKLQNSLQSQKLQRELKTKTQSMNMIMNQLQQLEKTIKKCEENKDELAYYYNEIYDFIQSTDLQTGILSNAGRNGLKQIHNQVATLVRK